MSKIVLQGTETGLVIPPDILADTGASLDSEFEVEVRPLPGEAEIRLRALSFVVQQLGDALGVGTVQREADHWVVQVLSPDASRCLGTVQLDRYGVVQPEASATYISVRQAA